MILSERINTFSALGSLINKVTDKEIDTLLHAIRSDNGWFDKENIFFALEGIGYLLKKEHLQAFCSRYSINESPVEKKIGVIMAGNIPAVGFHDLLMVLLAGHHAVVKLSSQDQVLMNYLINELGSINPNALSFIHIQERLNLEDLDAVIATGSNNTARYFETYFSTLPNIIRKNRTSCAVLTGEETEEEIEALGVDIFRYYGLGCRNVSKLFIPSTMKIETLFPHFEAWKSITNFSKYENNYAYYKSIFLVNQQVHLDTGYLLAVENKELFSPVGVLYYEYYDHKADVIKRIEQEQETIQCVVTNKKSLSNAYPFGKAQLPNIDDFADGVDTMAFLLTL